jgi:hypothetical protein
MLQFVDPMPFIWFDIACLGFVLVQWTVDARQHQVGIGNRAAIGIGWMLLIGVAFSYFEEFMGEGEIISFQPSEVLELDDAPTQLQVKNAYIRLGLMYTAPEAKRKFFMLTKAYKTLTDEAAFKNFENYGDPDGPQGFLSKNTLVWVLLVSFMLCIVVLPFFFARCWNRMEWVRRGFRRACDVFAYLVAILILASSVFIIFDNQVQIGNMPNNPLRPIIDNIFSRANNTLQ